MVGCISVQAYQHKILDYFLRMVVDFVHLVIMNDILAHRTPQDVETNRNSARKKEQNLLMIQHEHDLARSEFFYGLQTLTAISSAPLPFTAFE